MSSDSMPLDGCPTQLLDNGGRWYGSTGSSPSSTTGVDGSSCRRRAASSDPAWLAPITMRGSLMGAPDRSCLAPILREQAARDDEVVEDRRAVDDGHHARVGGERRERMRRVQRRGPEQVLGPAARIERELAGERLRRRGM